MSPMFLRGLLGFGLSRVVSMRVMVGVISCGSRSLVDGFGECLGGLSDAGVWGDGGEVECEVGDELGVFVGVGEDGYSAVSVFDVGGVPVGVGQSDAGGVSCGVDDGAHWFSRFS